MTSLLTDQDLHYFNEGTHFRLYEKLGAHPAVVEGEPGMTFAVWAPNAKFVSVIGDFNAWDPEVHPLRPCATSGLWAAFVPRVAHGALYKYHIVSQVADRAMDKADPFAFSAEVPPRTASRCWDLKYAWGDGGWMKGRAKRNALGSPVSIYEFHPGSWRRVPEEGARALSWRELAAPLAEHLRDLGFTHVEFLPVMEHPFYGSWGYQVTGYFAPTSRYGTPQDLMYLIDTLHRNGIGVILDWVPSHFPDDPHGLHLFDGTHLYEHADPRQGYHPDWNSWIFNYGRREVVSFLVSSALFWLEKYHVDGLRVDAVASMLYLDYSRPAGQWIPNVHGGRDNLDAVAFVKRLNEEVYKSHPDAQTIAEESTSWPMVSRPTFSGGLGFGLKWDMGWMHDTLDYMRKDPIHRSFNHDRLTFRMLYATTENFVLSLSHDEVVHGKGSLLAKMPGDNWQKFANLRALYGWMFGQSGKKLLFMGSEIAPWSEWNHDASLDWHLLDYAPHAGIQSWVRDLNRLYRSEPALHELDFEPEGFEWVDCSDARQSVVSFLRRGRSGAPVLAVYNFTPVPRANYRIGVPSGGFWKEILNSDGADYGGSGLGNSGGLQADRHPSHGRDWSLNLTLPPLSALFFKC